MAGAVVSPTMGSLLSGLRVLDLCDLRGAMAGRILADLGADVLRIEVGERTTLGRDGVASAVRNRNKRLAMTTASLEEWLEQADVVIDNRPETRNELGLPSIDESAERHRSLVQVCIRDLGLSGPRATWTLDPLPALAASGALFATGFPDRPPCWLPVHLAHDCASVHGAVGAIVAVTDRRRHGHGDLVEVSVQEAALAGLIPWSVCIEDYLHINPFFPAEGTRNADGSYWVLPAKDGYVRAVIGSEKQWRGFVELCGSPDAFDSDEWNDNVFRLMNADVIRVVAQGALVDRTRAELFEQALELETTIGVLHHPAEFVRHPQVVEREYFTHDPDLGPIAGAPWRFSETPARLPEPEVETRSGWVGEGWSSGHEASDDSGRALPLSGVRVVEFGVAAVVPELSWMLYELGADVIKIESSTHPDVLRQAGGDRPNCAFAFNAECRGRRSVAIDLSTELGRDLALRLCLAADVVAENQRGGSLASLGLDHHHVAAGNPDVIYVSSQGYGRTGPMAEMPAFGPLNSGFAGLHLLWNHDDAPYPCGTSMNHPDHIAGKLLACAVVAALDHRARSGEGQLIDMAQTEAAAYLVAELYTDALSGLEATGNRLGDVCPHDVYPAAGEDRWLAISVGEQSAWEGLCRLLGRIDLADLDGRQRVARRDEVDGLVAAWSARLDPESAAAALQEVGVSAMAVQGPKAHRSDPHLAERGFLVDLEHIEVGPERHVGNATRFERTVTRVAPSARPLGADTADVLAEVLGIGPTDYAELVDSGVCR